MIISTFKIDGKEYAIAEVVSAVEPIGYAEDGYSTGTRYGCCVRSAEIDAFLDDKTVNGDDVEQVVANSMPRWFALMIPGRVYSDEVRDMLLRNWNMSYTWGFRLDGFYPDAKRNSDGTRYYGERYEGVVLPRSKFNLEGMSDTLPDKFKLHFRSKVEDARREIAGGLSIDELYRRKS